MLTLYVHMLTLYESTRGRCRQPGARGHLSKVNTATLHRHKAVHVIAKAHFLLEPLRHAVKFWPALSAGCKFLGCLGLIDKG